MTWSAISTTRQLLRENKNKYILSLCALLVEKKIFRMLEEILSYNAIYIIICNSIYYIIQVKVSFPPVGHTHEDIDQLFSKISMALRRQGAESISGVYFKATHVTVY